MLFRRCNGRLGRQKLITPCYFTPCYLMFHRRSKLPCGRLVQSLKRPTGVGNYFVFLIYHILLILGRLFWLLFSPLHCVIRPEKCWETRFNLTNISGVMSGKFSPGGIFPEEQRIHQYFYSLQSILQLLRPWRFNHTSGKFDGGGDEFRCFKPQHMCMSSIFADGRTDGDFRKSEPKTRKLKKCVAQREHSNFIQHGVALKLNEWDEN